MASDKFSRGDFRSFASDETCQNFFILTQKKTNLALPKKFSRVGYEFFGKKLNFEPL